MHKLKGFFSQKQFGRLYKVGDKLVTFPKKMVLQLANWSRGPKRDSFHHDKRFVHAVLHVCAKDRLAKGEVREEEMSFIRREYFFLITTYISIAIKIFMNFLELMYHRTNNDENRMALIESYKDECQRNKKVSGT